MYPTEFSLMPRTDHPLVLSYRFRRQWNRLPPEVQAAVGKVLVKIRQGACRMKSLSAHRGLYEVRVTNRLRLIIERPGAEVGTIVRSVGDLDPILRRP
jgi:hypothetical protein